MVRIGESVGVVGPNATGKTTFVKMLAGEIEPDTGSVNGVMKISYKPQYISQEEEGTVQDYLNAVNYEVVTSGFFETQVLGPLEIKGLYDKRMKNLSGGELQRVAIA